MSTDPTTPSSRRPLPFRRRNDLVVEHIGFQGTGYWVVKDPVGLKYHRLRDEQYAALDLLNGEKSLYVLRRELVQRFPTFRPNLSDVQRLVVDLYEKGLVLSDRRGQGSELLQRAETERWKKVRQGAMSFLFLRLPGWDPEAVLSRLLPWTRWVFRPWAASLAFAFVLSSLILLLVNFDQFQSRLPEFQVFFGWPNVIWLWVVLAATKVLHEFGHGLSCKHYGSECHSMGIMLLVFSPTLYCDTSDSWMLRNKWHRIVIGAGGMYFEVVLSAIALWTWWLAPDSFLGNICLNVFFITSVSTVLFNLNPLMRFDGYYMLSDLLEIPNLRQQAERLLKETAAEKCFGIEPQHDPFAPRHGRGWFVFYAVAAWVYRLFLIVGISTFLYTMLKPYDLQSVGIVLAALSIGTMVYGALYSLYKMLAAPREEPLSRPRIAVTLLAVAGLVSAILLIPVPLHVEAPFVVEPRDVQHVHVTTPGELLQTSVTAGQWVEADAELLAFGNVDLEDQLHQQQLELAVLEKRLEAEISLRDNAAEILTRESIRSVGSQIADLERRLGELVVRAPIAGAVVAPEPRPEPEMQDGVLQLADWHGTLLDPWNEGAFVESGTQALSLAPTEEFVAVLYVGQSIRNDVFTDQAVDLKVHELPLLRLQSKVESISDRHDAHVPRALSNRYGGELPTLTDNDGRERLTETAYRIVVPLPTASHMGALRTGLRGRAAFLVTDRTLGQWIWRYVRQTFQFRL